MKAQWIRLADVFFIGPLMAWAGWNIRPRHPGAGYTFVIIGELEVRREA